MRDIAEDEKRRQRRETRDEGRGATEGDDIERQWTMTLKVFKKVDTNNHWHHRHEIMPKKGG